MTVWRVAFATDKACHAAIVDRCEHRTAEVCHDRSHRGSLAAGRHQHADARRSRHWSTSRTGTRPTSAMPIRMLSVDTPEVTARSPEGAGQGRREIRRAGGLDPGGQGAGHGAPMRTISCLAWTVPRGRASSPRASRHRHSCSSAVEERLTRPGGERRSLFIRMADQPFDDNGRLLAYVAPSLQPGGAAPRCRAASAPPSTSTWSRLAGRHPSSSIPSIPGELDYPLFVATAAGAIAAAQRACGPIRCTLLAYEYRAVEKLHGITARLVGGADLSPAERFGWRSRYCADVRTRRLHGPEDYVAIPPPYRLWLWPDDVPGSGDQAEPGAGTAPGRGRLRRTCDRWH